MKKKNLFRCFFSCLLVLSMCMTGIHAQETTGWNDHVHSDARVTVDAQSDQAFDSTENYALNKEVSVSGLEVPDRLLGPEAVDGSLDTRWSASPDEEEQWIIVDLGCGLSDQFDQDQFQRVSALSGARFREWNGL